jgi:hypothetical protein
MLVKTCANCTGCKAYLVRMCFTNNNSTADVCCNWRLYVDERIEEGKKFLASKRAVTARGTRGKN